MASIDDQLNVVLPIRDHIHAYHTPISNAVFRANYKVLAATKAELFKHGIGHAVQTGPTIAALTLMDEGKREAEERGDDGDMGATALLGDLKRLTLILAPTDEGWDNLPVDQAISAGHISQDEWDETEAALVFFTATYALAPKSKKKDAIEATASILEATTTSLPPMEWIGSTPTSTTGETSENATTEANRPAASSVPY